MTTIDPSLNGIPAWLMLWAPMVWYCMAIVAFWCGSGAFVFRSIMRARYSQGWLRVAAEPAANSLQRRNVRQLEDYILWVFPSAGLLIFAAAIGPFAVFAALVWRKHPTVEAYFKTRRSPD